MSEDQTTTLTKEMVTIAPQVLEEQMLQKEVDSPMGNPEDIAAVFFQRNLPRLRGLLKKLSKRAIARACMCASAYPLVPEGYKPQTEEEHELAWVMEQMVACKTMMIEATKLHKLNSIDELTVSNETLNKGE